MRPDPASSADTPLSSTRPVTLGFELPDDAWLARVRKAVTSGAPCRIGDYELIREIGRGGQGIVYQARQPHTGRLVALKRVSAGVFATHAGRQRLLREVEALAALDHPNIVTVFACEYIDDQAVLVMKWVDGVSISEWADGCRRDAAKIIGAFMSVCDALQHAHQRGIVHRDLKPSNILVDQDDRPHILDFGLAKLIDGDDSSAASLTQANFVGTLAYAAPEQFRGKPGDIDARTDVYALGAVLHYVLSGQAPLTDLGHRALPDRDHRRFQITMTPGSWAGELEAIVHKALSPEKEYRYSSVEALSCDLKRYLTGHPVAAYSARRRYHLVKFFQRNRLLSIAGGVVAALSIILVIRLFWWPVESGSDLAQQNSPTSSEQVGVDELARATRQYGNEAARQAAQQRAASEFLTGLFGTTTRPSDGKPVEPPIEVLEIATRQLDEGALRQQPEIEYKLRFQIASAYQRHKLFDQACRHFAAAVALARGMNGDDNARTADALAHLGAVQRDSRRLEDSEQSLRESIAISDRISPNGAGATWLGELAQTLRLRGNHTDAEYFFRRAAEEWTRGRGIKNRRAAVFWQQLAREQILLEMWPQAEASARKSIAAWEATGLTPDQGIFCLRALGHARHAQGDYSTAIECFKKALTVSFSAPGNSKCPAQIYFHLAAALLATGREDEGHSALLRAVSNCEVSEPGTAEFDAAVQRAASSLRLNAFRVDPVLLPLLGDFVGLVSSDLVLVSNKSSTTSTSAPTAETGD